MSSTQSPLASAAVFAGGLAVGIGSFYALSRSSISPATHVTKSTKEKVIKQFGPESSTSSKSKSIQDIPASVLLDSLDAKSIGPHKPTSGTHSSKPLIANSTTSTGTPLNGLQDAAQSQSGDLPEPNDLNRIKTSDTKMTLNGSIKENVPSANHSKASSPIWLTGLIGSQSSLNSTSQGLIENITYNNSNSIFVYESSTNAGFGQWVESQSKEFQKKGWRSGPKVFSMQTRSGAGNAIAGYMNQVGNGSGASVEGSAEGNKVVTALTNAEGLLSMASAISGLSSDSSTGKLVLQVSAASQKTDREIDGLKISNDYASIMSAASILGDQEDQTFTLILSGNREEAGQIASSCYAGPANGNVVHVFDGAYSAREVASLEIPSSLKVQDASTSVVSSLLSKGLGHFDYHGSSTPSTVLILPNGSHSNGAKAVLASLPESVSSEVGILCARIIRPWSDEELVNSLPSSVKNIHVLDETRCEGSTGILYEDVLSSILGSVKSNVDVKSFSISAGTTLCTSQWAAVLLTLRTTKGAKEIKIQDSTFASLAEKARVEILSSTTPNSPRLVTVFDQDSSSTAHLSTLLSRTFRERSDGSVHSRMLTRFDNYEQGGLVRGDIVLSQGAQAGSQAPLELISQLGSSDTLVISDAASILKSLNVFQSLKVGGTVIFNTPGWDEAELSAKLRAEDKKTLASKQAKVYLVDASEVVEQLDSEASQARGGKATQQIVPEEVTTAVLLTALVRQHFDSSPESLTSILERVLGTAPLGPGGVESLVDATIKGIQLVAYNNSEWSTAEPISEAEADAAVRPSQLQYNGFSASADAATVGLEPQPLRSNWALPAFQIMFSEAYQLDQSSLRPDLPEENFIVKVTENRRLTPVDYDRNVFHMEFSTKGTGLKYEIGEALGIHGWNDAKEVEDFIQWSGYNPDEIISIPSLENPNKWESRTVYQILQQRLDIFGKPPKRFYEELSKLATNVDEARWLRFISSAEGNSTFKKLSESETVTYADVLRMFPSARLPIDRLLTEVEGIKPRHYSIASAQAAVGDSVHLLIVTVDWKTPSGSPRYGQCTRYLANLKVGDEVTVSLKPSVMKLPPISTQPIIMAGLGTGAAPFRAFIQARAHQKQMGMEVGPLVYYFGSRYRASEFLYGEE